MRDAQTWRDCTAPLYMTARFRALVKISTNQSTNPEISTRYQNTQGMSTSPGNVLLEGIERKKKSGWARSRARKARKVAQAGPGEPQQKAETVHKAPEQAEAVREKKIKKEEARVKREQEAQVARAEKMRKKEEANLKREQEAQAAHAEKMKTLTARGAFLVHSYDDLRPYGRYTHIYGERKFQKPVVSTLWIWTYNGILINL